MSSIPSTHICPHLGLSSDRTITALAPTHQHRCYKLRRTLAPESTHQVTFCLGENHVNCPLLVSKHPIEHVSPQNGPHDEITAPTKKLSRRVIGSFVGAIILILVLATAYQVVSTRLVIPAHLIDSNNLNEGVTVQTEAAPTAIPATPVPAQVASAGVPNIQIVAQVALPTVTATATADHSLAAERFTTPTAVPGGEVFLLGPEQGDAGWWSSKGQLRNHLGDSFLYAGTFEGQTFTSGIRFDLDQIPRGAPIPYAQLRLTGLRGDRLMDGATGSWLVQLVPESAVSDLSESDFLTFYSAPASITLFPQLGVADLAEQKVNSWILDEPTRLWLAQQRLDGATSVIVRILAGTENGETLFAWDSGLGPETAGNAATLLLSVGEPPPTPPALPTKPVIVATATPVPANVMTVVAYAATATAEAYAFGTRTPLPYQVVTPTPLPENLATVQANSLAEGLLPVILDTPVPLNEATATYNAEYATAVALTTGTFTPVPPNYVTPVLIYPPPPAENVATAAARVIEATRVAASGAATPTPPPYNAVNAVYAFATETPSNAEIAVAQVREQNAAAATTGTPTPTPWNLVVITSVPPPTPTEIPLPTTLPLIEAAAGLTPTPTPTATRIITLADLAQFRDKILFLSDRSGSEEVWVMDPESGEVLSLIRDPQFLTLAREQLLTLSKDGREQVVVQADNNQDLQIKILSLEYGTARQVTHFRGTLSYDPAWSPLGNQIAFVSTNSGNDEIYVVDPEGVDVQQLTHNNWEWDKHPSWSPDGNRIAFYSNRDVGRTQIWIMNADGTGQRNLSNNSYNDWDPVWIR